MPDLNGAATCRWAQPTLFLEPPLWIEAADRPWTCTRHDVQQPLQSTIACVSCPQWQSRDASDHPSGHR
jgi:hypothetical protein